MPAHTKGLMKLYYARVDGNHKRILFETQEALKDYVADYIMLENFFDGEATKIELGSQEMDEDQFANLPEWDGD